MKENKESTRSPLLDSLLLAISVMLLVAGTGAYYWFQDQAMMPVRVAGLILVALLAMWVAAQTKPGSTLFRFLRESDIERRKVIWPTHQETMQTSLMVIVVTILISLLLAGIDWLLGAGVRALLSGG